jgi:hypothetical protein
MSDPSAGPLSPLHSTTSIVTLQLRASRSRRRADARPVALRRGRAADNGAELGGRMERVLGIEPTSRAWKARPVPAFRPDATPMTQVRAACCRPLLSVSDRQLPMLRARGGHGRQGPSALQHGGDGHELNRRVRPVHDDHLPRWQVAEGDAPDSHSYRRGADLVTISGRSCCRTLTGSRAPRKRAAPCARDRPGRPGP